MLMRHCLTNNYIDDFGLQFFFNNCKDLGIAKELIKSLYEAIIEIERTELQELVDIPAPPEAPPAAEGEEPKQVSEEEKQAYELVLNEVK